MSMSRYGYMALLFASACGFHSVGGPADGGPPDGSGGPTRLGAFSPMSTVLTTPRFRHGLLATSAYLYVLGGVVDLSFDVTDSIERAPIMADGSLGAFESAGALTTRRGTYAELQLGAYVYLIGGSDGSALLSSVERAMVGSDGTLGPFRDAGTALAQPRRGHELFMSGGFVYVLGGDSSAGGTIARTTTIERAPILPDSTLGPFVPLPDVALDVPRSRPAVAAANGAVFIVGGSDANNNPIASTAVATLAADGSLSAIAPAGANLQASRESMMSLVIGGTIVVIGGRSDSSVTPYLATIEEARPAGAALGAFVKSTVSLTVPRASCALARGGVWAYAVGGYNGSGVLGSLEQAPLQ
jgi:hypothetical protein